MPAAALTRRRRLALEALRRLPARRPWKLRSTALAPSYRLWAIGSPFESKEVLKKRGYWWDAPKRCWYGEFRSREAIDLKLAWLRESVYAGKCIALELEEFDARTQYSQRDGRREKVRT